jgi:uncharacterized membrane protein
MSFHDTLHAHDRRLALRLEGLGDVVVGFAMSQLVIQLPQAGQAIHARSAVQVVAYFGTFAVLVMLWLNFHRMMSTAFAPRRFDLFLAFAYLGFASLMPYAMNSVFAAMRDAATISDSASAYAIGTYALAFSMTFLTSSIIWWRNLRRGWYHFEDEERNVAWRSTFRLTAIGIMMAVVLLIDIFAGPQRAGLSFALLFIPQVLARFFRTAPSAAALRIPALEVAAKAV